MATQAELATELRAVKDQLVKAKAEILAKVAALETAVGNAGNTSPEVDAAFADLRGEVQSVDDLNPDSAPPTP